MKHPSSWLMLLGIICVGLSCTSVLHAQEATEAAYSYDWSTSEVSEEMFTVNNLWVMIAAMLVFIMHLGFAMVESGLTRAKNTVNILFKNSFIIAIGVITYALVGFNTHYPGDFNGWFSIGKMIGDLTPTAGTTGDTAG